MIDLIDEWVVWQWGQQRSPKTIKKYRQGAGMLLRWLGDRPVTIENLYQYRLHRQRERHAPATIRADFTAAYDFFRWAESAGRATNLPARGSVKLQAIGEQDADAPSDAEVQLMFRRAAESPTHTERAVYLRGRKLGILAILAGSGLRLQEMLSLNVSDIDRSQRPWTVSVACGKGAQTATVPFAEIMEPHLEEWLAVRVRWCLRHHHTSDALFPVDKERRLCERGLYTVWRELVSQCGITWKFTPKCMRTWYGSKMQEMFGLATAQRMLRHKRMETTLRYLKTSEEKQRMAAQGLKFNLPTENERKRESPKAPPTVAPRTGGRVPRSNGRRRAA